VKAGSLRKWERYSWAAGIVFVAALVAESVISVAVHANQDDSASKIATELHDHRSRLVVIACISIVYAVAFVVYLTRLQELLRDAAPASRVLHWWVLTGGVLFVTLHGVSDIGITGMLGAKVASYAAQHDIGLSYTLYLLTFALDSVGDVFASLFALAAAAIVIRSGVLPRWLGWVLIAVSPLFFLQGFGLGGVISTFGLILDLIGFLLLLIFVLASSVVGLRREHTPSAADRAAASV
jgi:hypothetical protein